MTAVLDHRAQHDLGIVVLDLGKQLLDPGAFLLFLPVAAYQRVQKRRRRGKDAGGMEVGSPKLCDRFA